MTDTIARIAPEVPLLIRTRFKGDRATLADLGATEIVAEEVEASIEIVARFYDTLKSHATASRSNCEQFDSKRKLPIEK